MIYVGPLAALTGYCFLRNVHEFRTRTQFGIQVWFRQNYVASREFIELAPIKMR